MSRTKHAQATGRRMWQYEAIDGTSFVTNLREEHCKQKPVLVLPIDAAAVRALEKEIAFQLQKYNFLGADYSNQAKAVLMTLGIKK